ncbi:MAG: acyl-CoA synthetase (AMP-forming)/AMP-acid ligase II [Paracoccaceae bacterium]|jgi:acyl-CoA synthetase (AMP-forming)/AMP-acid ligase II
MMFEEDTMNGMMMQTPLKIVDILAFAAQTHKDAEVVSVRCEGDIHRQSYPETFQRAAQLAHALVAHGISQGDRVATLAWNGHRHLELYYAISGIGAVCHTINPRLSAEQMLYIISHAGDRLLFVDLTFVPLIAALADRLPADLRFVIMTDRPHMPQTGFASLCYEEMLAGQAEQYDWPDLPENSAAALCYTSGTTGNPKGVLFSHRSTVLHAMMVIIALPDALRPGRKILPVVPLFHVNAWGLPYAAPLAGAGLVFPGSALDGESLFDLMNDEQVYSAWGVPTVWTGLLAQIKAEGRLPAGFGDVVIGGSAASPSMIATFEAAGVNVCHAWGMTEMSPVGTQGNLPAGMAGLSPEERLRLKSKQGRALFGVDLKIVDEAGRRLPHDGAATGALFVRGNSVASGYFENPEASAAACDAEGWFSTGDIASIDPDGFMSISDRAKDLIKSGGEWISSIDLENIVMAHKDVAGCAVIAVPHPKWEERPLLVVALEPGCLPDAAGLMAMFGQEFANWQLPDDVVFVEALPLTATGKVSKLELRARLAGHVLPEFR